VSQPQQDAVTLLPADQAFSNTTPFAHSGTTLAYPSQTGASSYDGIRIQNAVSGAFSLISTASTLPGQMEFSPSGHLFVAVTELPYPAGTSYGVYLFRLDGVDASAAIPTAGTLGGNAPNVFALQPVN
jgi:hypothetical protein